MFPVPRKPHDSRITGGVSHIIGSTETMMITQGDQRIWLQGGRVYDEAGVELEGDQIPGWFQSEYKKLTPLMQDTHPVDGSAPAGTVNLKRRARIDELRKELAQLEEVEINSGAGTKVGEGPGSTGPVAVPVDETDEEHLQKQTKEQIMQLAADEDIELDGKLKKDDLIQAFLAARREKQEGSKEEE